MIQEEELVAAIEDFDGKLGLAVRTDDGRPFVHNADATFEPASIIKLIPFIAAFERLDLEKRITVPKALKAGGWGVLQFLTDGVELSLRDLATLMMIISDNVATDLVLCELSPTDIQETIETLGLSSTRMESGFGTSFQPETFSGKNVTRSPICSGR